MIPPERPCGCEASPPSQTLRAALARRIASATGKPICAFGRLRFADPGNIITNAKTGTIEALTGTITEVADDAMVNSGTIKVSAAEFIDAGGPIDNAGTITAWGGSYRGEIALNSVVNNGGGTIVASGNAEIEIDGATISGGVLATSGSSALIFVSSSAAISAASIAAGSLVEASGGTLTLGSGTVIGKGATVEAISGGTAVVNGAVTDSGALLAEQDGTVAIASGVSVSGAAVQIGTLGAVVMSGDGTTNVTFLSGAVSGGLYLADTATDSGGYSGTVSGFGGSNGTDTTQFIDLTSVTYSGGEVSASYTANGAHPTSGGVLTVVSSGVTVADINLAGNYTHATFDVVSGANDTVAITDPSGAALGGGTITPLGWWTPATLANTAPPPLLDFTGASNVALLGSYMASLLGSVEGHASPPTTPDALQTQAALAQPHTG